MGAVADRVRTYLPATYDALSKSSQYGASALQNSIDGVKFRLFGSVVDAAIEASTYDAFTLDMTAKVSAIRIIPGACDWWSDQMTSESAKGESISYPDRIASLWKIHERLVAEVRSDWPYFTNLNPTPDWLRRSASSSPRVNTVSDLLTPDPADFGKRATYEEFGTSGTTAGNWTSWG